MSVEVKDKILCIQFRVQPQERGAEQELIMKIGSKAQIPRRKFLFAGPLQDKDDGSGMISASELTPHLLNEVAAVISLGTDKPQLSAASISPLSDTSLQDRVDSVMQPFYSKLIEMAKPGLLICYSEQLYGRYFDGGVERVRDNPSQRVVYLHKQTDDVPALRKIPDMLSAMAIHQDALTRKPKRASVAGIALTDPLDPSSVWDRFAVLQIGEELLGSQLHLEKMRRTQPVVATVLGDAMDQAARSPIMIPTRTVYHSRRASLA